MEFIPAGNGTFGVTLCTLPTGDVYIVGPFTAEGEGDYWSECIGNAYYKMTLNREDYCGY